MSNDRVDLRSDTVTRPTAAMRAAMASDGAGVPSDSANGVPSRSAASMWFV